MAPPQTRRASRSSNTGKKPPAPVEPAPEDQIEVEEPVIAPTEEFPPQDQDAPAPAPAAEAPGASAVSDRRAAGRSGRRPNASDRAKRNSGKSPSARSAPKLLTPEELAERRASRNQAIMIVLGLLIAGLVIGGAVFLLREKQTEKDARRILREVEGLIHNIDNDLTTLRDPAAANLAREQAVKLLDVAELGYAKRDPDIKDPKLSTPELAAKAADRKDELLGTWKDKVEKLERDVRVVANRAEVLNGFVGIQEIKDEQLANFERKLTNFLDNPVLPGSGRSDEYVKEYDVDLASVRTQMSKIADEKDRRDRAITDQPVREARGLAAIAVQQEKFQDGLAQIDELARKYTTANFDALRTYVRESAKLAWETALSASDQNYKTYISAGTTADMKEKSLKAAQDRMQQVIDRFGLPEYVSQAEEAKGRYKAKD